MIKDVFAMLYAGLLPGIGAGYIAAELAGFLLTAGASSFLAALFGAASCVVMIIVYFSMVEHIQTVITKR